MITPFFTGKKATISPLAEELTDSPPEPAHEVTTLEKKLECIKESIALIQNEIHTLKTQLHDKLIMLSEISEQSRTINNAAIVGGETDGLKSKAESIAASYSATSREIESLKKPLDYKLTTFITLDRERVTLESQINTNSQASYTTSPKLGA